MSKYLCVSIFGIFLLFNLAMATEDNIGIGDSVNVYVIRSSTINVSNNSISYYNQTNYSIIINQQLNITDNITGGISPIKNTSDIVIIPEVISSPIQISPSNQTSSAQTVNSNSIMTIIILIILLIGEGIFGLIYYLKYLKERKIMNRIPTSILEELEFVERRNKENGGTNPDSVLWELAKVKRERSGIADTGSIGIEGRSIPTSPAKRYDFQGNVIPRDKEYNNFNTRIEPRNEKRSDFDTRPERNNRISFFRRLFKRKG